MIRSMTAFARQERQGEWGVLVWELRAVNQRYLELTVRLPDELKSLETAVRERATAGLGRGKVECALRYQPGTQANAPFAINAALVQRLVQALRDVEAQMPSPAPVNALDLLRWPGVVEKPELDMQPLQVAALELFDAALIDLVEMRGREGQRLKELIEQRCATMSDLVQQARVRLPEVLTRQRDKLAARLAELALGADPGRLEQEMVIQAQKLDIAEEIDRLEGHIGEVRRIMGRPEAVGRKLDFLMQELNREANTLGSKSADAETTRISVDLKVLIEQMREQIQNIE